MVENDNEEEKNEGFYNQQVWLDNLPSIADIAYEKIQYSLMYVNLIVTGIVYLFVLLGVSMLAYFIEDIQVFYLYIIVVITFVFILIFFVEIKAFRFRGFALRTYDIIYKEGWLWRSTMVIPFNRIQHLEIHQGPIDRMFDLSSLTIFTAGGSSSDLEINGLLPDQAAAIKTFIMSKNQNQHSDESE